MAVCILGRIGDDGLIIIHTCLMVGGIRWWRYPYDNDLPEGLHFDVKDQKVFACYQGGLVSWKCWFDLAGYPPDAGVLETDIMSALSQQLDTM